MFRVRMLALAQRIVIVVGMGVLLGFVAVYAATDGFRASTGGGWFAYAPGTDVYFSTRRIGRMRTLVIPIALIVVWTAASAWLLGGPRSAARTRDGE